MKEDKFSRSSTTANARGCNTVRESVTYKVHIGYNIVAGIKSPDFDNMYKRTLNGITEYHCYFFGCRFICSGRN